MISPQPIVGVTGRGAAGQDAAARSVDPAGRRGSRGFLLPALLGLFGLASIAGAAYLWTTRLPDPLHSDRRQLFRWLATRDLTKESAETRTGLIRRFEEELDLGIDVGQATGEMPSEYRGMFWANVDVLIHQWCVEQVDEYFRLPGDQREAFLEHRIAQVRRWGLVELFALRGNRDRKLTTLETYVALEKRVQPWIEEAAPADQKRMIHVLKAVKSQIFFKAVGRALKLDWGH